MVKKRLMMVFAILIVLMTVGSQLTLVGATTSEDSSAEDAETEIFDEPAFIQVSEPISDGVFTFIEPPLLSEDGKILLNMKLPVVLKADPEMEIPDQINYLPQGISLTKPKSAMTTATFAITYKADGTVDPWGTSCTTFPEDAKTAFDAAAAIWATRIESPVPITISACWADDLDSGVLGYSGGGSWHRDFDGAPMADTWYQAALANSLAGIDLNPSSYDMYIAYSASFKWYYGTDGNPPGGQYDLVTVAAHEIAHGLNFSGRISYNEGEAQYGSAGSPCVYGSFIENADGTKMTEFANPSEALGDLVTSDNIWWNGTYANANNNGMRVKMYAPESWSPGSSFNHLDYDTFSGTINQMMVYAYVSPIHDPGPVTMGILRDMGWRLNRYIISDDFVFDNTTNLEWQRVMPQEIYDYDSAVSYCDNLVLSGKSDWKLPGIRELRSIVNLAKNDPALDVIVFPDTPSEPFWASTPFAGISNHGWWVDFEHGDSGNADMTETFHVRCVRCIPDCSGRECGPDGCGGSCGSCSSEQICTFGTCETPAAEGTWTDPSSGLNWQVTPTGYIHYYSAAAHCQTLSLGGGGWRLPTISELRSLIRGCPATETGGSCNIGDGCLEAICQNYPCWSCPPDEGPEEGCYWPGELEGPCCWYWSSSMVEDNLDYPWSVQFDTGHVRYYLPLCYSSNIRCVR